MDRVTEKSSSELDPAAASSASEPASPTPRPTSTQLKYLRHGLDQPGGKLPLFDEHGQAIRRQTIRSCIDHGWAEPWFANPIKPDWLVCRLTDAGRAAVQKRAAS